MPQKKALYKWVTGEPVAYDGWSSTFPIVFESSGTLRDCGLLLFDGTTSSGWIEAANDEPNAVCFGIIEVTNRPNIAPGSLNWIQGPAVGRVGRIPSHWYALTPGKGTWKEADAAAKAQGPGAHLVTITSKEEHDFVRKNLLGKRGSTDCWIGLRYGDKVIDPPKKHGYWRVHLRTGERTWVNGIADGTPAQDRANLRVPTTR